MSGIARPLSLGPVSVGYGSRAVLEQVTLDVEPATFTVVIGPNGCGKTTLLRVAAGVLGEHSRVHYGGVPLADLSPREQARRRAYVPQVSETQVPYDVGTMLSFATAHRQRFFAAATLDYDASAAVLEELGVQTDLRRAFRELSGGERQQILLARALLQATPLILLDEPTSALDLEHKVRLVRALRRRCDAGAAIVSSTHELSLAAAVADRVVLLAAGKIVADGSPAEVLTAAILEPVYRTPLRAVIGADGRPSLDIAPEAWR